MYDQAGQELDSVGMGIRPCKMVSSWLAPVYALWPNSMVTSDFVKTCFTFKYLIHISILLFFFIINNNYYWKTVNPDITKNCTSQVETQGALHTLCGSHLRTHFMGTTSYHFCDRLLMNLWMNIVITRAAHVWNPIKVPCLDALVRLKNTFLWFLWSFYPSKAK